MQSINLLGVNVHDAIYEQIVQSASDAIKRRGKITLFAVNVHTFIEAINNSEYREALNSATVSYPDGVPILWASNLVAERLPERIFGPELMLRLLKATKHTNFIIGGTPLELEKAQANLTKLIPDLKVAGTLSPPFRKLSQAEEDDLINTINKAKPDILWVALGAPKQEMWVYKHKDKLNVPVIAAIGAAVKYHAKIIRESPSWMHNYGLEWVWRLLQEPKRLWQRYLFTNTQFIWLITKELLRKKFCRR